MLKPLMLTLVVFATTGLAPCQDRTTRFAGVWEAKFNGTVFCVLTLAESAKITGTILSPGSIRVNEEGDLVEAEPSRTGDSAPIRNASVDGGKLSFEFQADDETLKMLFSVTGDGKAELKFVDEPIKPIPLTRK
jgi:hypothetical protein